MSGWAHGMSGWARLCKLTRAARLIALWADDASLVRLLWFRVEGRFVFRGAL